MSYLTIRRSFDFVYLSDNVFGSIPFFVITSGPYFNENEHRNSGRKLKFFETATR